MNESKLFAKAFLHLFKLLSMKRIAEVLEVNAEKLKELRETAEKIVREP